MQLLSPFSSKELADGKKLYRRKHGYKCTLNASGTTTYSITVPYSACKINEAEIVWAPEGCTVNMKVKDSATGTYSGTPNATLQQFGYNVNISKDFFSDISQYDADVYTGMVIEFEFTASLSAPKEIGINLVFHQVV